MYWTDERGKRYKGTSGGLAVQVLRRLLRLWRRCCHQCGCRFCAVAHEVACQSHAAQMRTQIESAHCSELEHLFVALAHINSFHN